MSKWRHERSSRLIRNLSNCEREAWKKFRLQRDSNPWPLRYRCSALPTELWSHNCWEQVNFSGSIMPLRVIQHYSDWVCTAVMSKWRHERSSRLIRNLSNCEREAWKKFLFRNCLNCVSTAKIFHDVIFHSVQLILVIDATSNIVRASPANLYGRWVAQPKAISPQMLSAKTTALSFGDAEGLSLSLSSLGSVSSRCSGMSQRSLPERRLGAWGWALFRSTNQESACPDWAGEIIT